MKLPLVVVFFLAGSVLADPSTSTALGVPAPSAPPVPNSIRSQGCWAAQGDWTKQPPLGFPSSGSCRLTCFGQNYTVSALQGSDCFCGDDYPPQGTNVPLEECNYPCPGYPLEACGGIGTPPTYSVFNTGVKVYVPYKVSSSSSTSSPSATSSNQQIVVVTQPASSSSSGGGSSSAAGIAAGVVVGIVVLAAIGGAVFFYMRRKRRREDEEERKRVATVDAFVRNGKPSSFSTSPGSINDSRLDPVLAHRRLSDGSIADNQDYSRKILRVINA